MTTKKIRIRLESAVAKVADEVTKDNYVNEWQEWNENLLWQELVACIIGSGVLYEQAKAAIQHLSKKGIVDAPKPSCSFDEMEAALVEILSQPILPPQKRNGELSRYRFPKLRANHIRRTAEAIYLQKFSIKYLLKQDNDAPSARKRLVNIAVGIGPKQASLFLRNIGEGDNLAILDTHVLKYMFLIGLLPKSIQTVPTLSTYERLEETLRDYSQQMGVNLGYLDIAIWVVMRVYQREYA